MTCEVCKKPGDDVLQRKGSHWLCEAFRVQWSKLEKAGKKAREIASYRNATTHPDLRGLKGVRK